MRGQLRLEPLGPHHAAVLSALQSIVFPHSPWSEEDCRTLLSSQGVFGWLACGREEDAPCGFLLARQAGDEAEILTIGLLSASRGKGLGEKMLKALLESCGPKKVRKVFLEVSEDNLAAIRLYERAGFSPVGRRPGYYTVDGMKQDALLMRRSAENK